MTKKDKIILAVAAVIPFGLTALGIWKAYELIKGKINEETNNVRNKYFVDTNVDWPDIERRNAKEIQEQQDREDSQKRLKAKLQRKRLQDSEENNSKDQN